MARTSRNHDIYPISLREIVVKDSYDLSPGMRRVIFTGDDLGAHTFDGVHMPAVVSDGFDDDVRLIFPHPETGERPYPKPLGDGRLDWTEEIMPLFRTYTVRSFDADSKELVIDFARHGKGLAETWSVNAEPGNKLYMAGPKHCASLPTHRDRLILVGDETAIPAIARALEELPATYPVTVFISVATAAHTPNLATDADADIRVCVADKGDDVMAAFADYQPPAGQSIYLWAAGESTRLKTVRAWAKNHQIDRSDVDITGYWRQTDATTTASNAVVRELRAKADIAPGLIFLAAFKTGIFPLIDDGATTPHELACAAGVDELALVRLLRYLHSEGLVEVDYDAEGGIRSVGLTSLSKELADPESKVTTTLGGAHALAMESLIGLESSLRTGQPAHIGATGMTFEQMAIAQPRLAAMYTDQAAGSAGWTAPAFAADNGLPVSETIAIVGQGAAVYADEVIRRGKATKAIVVTTGVFGDTADAARANIDPSRAEAITLTQWSETITHDLDSAERVVVVDPFGIAGLSAAAIIQAIPTDEIVLVTELIDPMAGDPEDLEHDLMSLALTATSTPTRLDVSRLAADSGYRVAGARPVGWGKHAIVLASRKT